MDKKDKKYRDDYSLRTLAYYQRKGGIYNDLITILQRLREEPRMLHGIRIDLPSPKQILNTVSRAYDACLDICTDDEGRFYCFTEDNIDSFLEAISEILYGIPFTPTSPEYFETSTGDKYLGQLQLCVLASLLARIPEMEEIIPFLTKTAKRDYPQLYTQFVLLIDRRGDDSTQIEKMKRELKSQEQIICLKDSEIKEKDSQIKQLTELKEILSITVERYKNDEIQRSNFDRILNLDTILKFAEGRKSYKRAAPILNMLTHLAFNTATDEEYQKIVSIEDKLLEINETEVAIFNENKAFGSNLFTGIVNSPYFPIGVEETTIMKGLLPIVEDYFKRTYGDGARRENKD